MKKITQTRKDLTDEMRKVMLEAGAVLKPNKEDPMKICLPLEAFQTPGVFAAVRSYITPLDWPRKVSGSTRL